MPADFQIQIEPSGVTLNVAEGTSLQSCLFEQGMEFPCGGRGTCRRCRVTILDGDLPATDVETRELTPDELNDGVRLACLHKVHAPLRLHVEQWSGIVLDDDKRLETEMADGYGIAVDLGTTTVAAQLMDLAKASTLGVQTGRNSQSVHGADLMSRISHAVENGQEPLQNAIREQIGEMVAKLATSLPNGDPLANVMIVGNTAMHNLFCGIDVTPLSVYPFDPTSDDAVEVSASSLNWVLPGDPKVVFLPCLGSFVGSDVLAGVIATGIHHSDKLNVFVDLGTNGEIVAGNRDQLLCASTAAGPAFEAAQISQGMQATQGAINRVQVVDGKIECGTIGDIEARGICGSGLVDAVAALLETGDILPSGRFSNGGDSFALTDQVSLSQKDVRELQLAKGAVAVGIRVLVDQLGKTMDDIDQVLVAGAFGNYVNLESAQRIGMLDVPLTKVRTVGNSALRGAKASLLKQTPLVDCDAICAITEHVILSSHPKFQDFYIDEMVFP